MNVPPEGPPENLYIAADAAAGRAISAVQSAAIAKAVLKSPDFIKLPPSLIMKKYH
jgi:hypothetical protein